MRLAIASDLHDNLFNLDIFLNWLKQENISVILFCGDATREDTLAYLSSHFAGTVHLVEGNAETYQTKNLNKYPNLKDYGRDAYLKLGNLKILATHKKTDLPDARQKIHQTLDFIFYGHSHKPWLEKDDQTIIANPGNLANIGYSATWSVLDTYSKNLELKLLSDIA